MVMRPVRAAAAVTLGGTALLSSATSFVPQLLGWRSSDAVFSAGGDARPRPSASASSWVGSTHLSTAVATAATAVAVVAGMRRRGSHRAAKDVACNGQRRELAVAYEDSGIELLDNGKFAQGLIGADGAWGRYEFDPAGFSRFTEFVPYFREAELKHGRIAMLAWLGLVVPDFVRIPGERYGFDYCPLTIDAHDKLNGAIGVNFQILFWITIVELCCAKKVFEWNSLECAGDYGFGVKFLPKDEDGQKRMRMAELKNGRLAMIAFGGSITQAVITQHPFPWLY